MRVLATLVSFATTASAFTTSPVLARHVAFTTTTAPRIQGNTIRMMSTESVEFVNSQVGSSDVVIFSKSFCPFCKKTKKLFSSLNVEPTVFELNQMDDGESIQDALLEITGQKTVPNVFIKGQHIGGNDDTQKAAKAGDIQKLLGI